MSPPSSVPISKPPATDDDIRRNTQVSDLSRQIDRRGSPGKSLSSQDGAAARAAVPEMARSHAELFFFEDGEGQREC